MLGYYWIAIFNGMRSWRWQEIWDFGAGDERGGEGTGEGGWWGGGVVERLGGVWVWVVRGVFPGGEDAGFRR